MRFSPQLLPQPARQTVQPVAIATRLQPTHSAKKKLARRNRRVRRLLQAYTAMAQAATLTSSTASAGWPRPRRGAETTGWSQRRRTEGPERLRESPYSADGTSLA